MKNATRNSQLCKKSILMKHHGVHGVAQRIFIFQPPTMLTTLIFNLKYTYYPCHLRHLRMDNGNLKLRENLWNLW